MTSSSVGDRFMNSRSAGAPNLDDGVRLNIRPFIRTELQSGGRKGAGILRAKPNIKWNKDRGREPESLRPRDDFPWFYSCPGQGSEDARTDYTAPPKPHTMATAGTTFTTRAPLRKRPVGDSRWLLRVTEEAGGEQAATTQRRRLPSGG